jgi:hypothetical protein
MLRILLAAGAKISGRAYFATPDMMRARANIRLSGMSASIHGIKKRNPSAPRKTKSRVLTLIEVLVSRQMTNKRGIDQIATVNAVSPYVMPGVI